MSLDFCLYKIISTQPHHQTKQTILKYSKKKLNKKYHQVAFKIPMHAFQFIIIIIIIIIIGGVV